MAYKKSTYKELGKALEYAGTEKENEYKLLSLIQSDAHIGSLTLPRIIGIDVLQKLQDEFARAHNVASVIFDINGKPVTKFSNFSEFCRIIRGTEKGRKGCIRSDRRLGEKSIRGKSGIEPCGNIKEIMDGAFPIIIQGRHVATWGIGQAVTGSIDEDEIRRFARKIGAEEDKLVEASKKLVRMPWEHFGKILDFLRIMSEHVSSFAVQNIHQAFLISQLKQAKEAVQKARDELEIRVEERTAELKQANIRLKQEIEERRQAEKALRNAEENWRDSFNSLEDVMLVIDKDYNVENINDNGLKLLGKSKEEVIGKKCYKMIHRTDAPGEFCPLKRSLETKVVESVDRYEELFGRHFSIKSSPIFDEKGGIIRFVDLMIDITDRKQAEKQLQDTLNTLRRAVGTTIQVMVSAVEARDPYTAGHQLRVADLARAIATEMGLSKDRIEGIRMAGSIHDIGKLSMPAEILSKPGNLSNLEFLLIEEHPLKGYEILKNIESPWPLAQIVYQHHERMDGSGYPRSLKGDEILMEARILAVADVVEAMASHRPYRCALGINIALEEIENNRVTLYDADVADTCLRLFREKGFRFKDK